MSSWSRDHSMSPISIHTTLHYALPERQGERRFERFPSAGLGLGSDKFPTGNRELGILGTE